MGLYLSLYEALWLRVQQCSHGNDCPYCCWEWKGSRTSAGYGDFMYDYVKYYAHRTSFEIWNNYTLKEKELVCHHCDNPACCNPMHLTRGTKHSNVQDAKSRGRLHYQQMTHCKWGHPFNAINTHIRKSNGQRECRACKRRHSRMSG